MKIRKSAIAVLLCLAYTVEGVAAEDSPEKSMLLAGGEAAIYYSIQKVHLNIVDQVKDSCMPQPNSVKRSAEAELRRNGFSIADEESYNPIVLVNAIGYETTSSSCAVYFEAFLRVYRGVRVPYTNELDSKLQMTVAPIMWGFYGTLLSGSKADMQGRLEDEAEKAMTELFIQIDRARDKVKERWPQLWEARFKE